MSLNSKKKTHAVGASTRREYMRGLGAGALALTSGVTWWAGEASAFIPSARWLLQTALAQHIERNLKTLKATYAVERYDVPSHPKGYSTTRTEIYAAPDRLRRETAMESGTLLEVQNGKQSLVDMPGQGKKKSKTRLNIWDAWFTAGPPLDPVQARTRVVKAAERIGIDIDTVSYSRFDGRVNYLIGSKPWGEQKPQLWLEKDRLLLTRVVWFTPSAEGDKKVRREIRFLGWGSATGAEWLPEAVERYKGEKLLERSMLRDVQRNEPVDSALFLSPRRSKLGDEAQPAQEKQRH